LNDGNVKVWAVVKFETASNEFEVKMKSLRLI